MNHYEALDDRQVVPQKISDEVYDQKLTFFYRGVTFDWTEEEKKEIKYLSELIPTFITEG